MKFKDIKPGKDLDCSVAEFVMGIKPSEEYGWFGWHPRANAECDEWQESEGVKKYSTDISAAWEVVQKLKGYCYLFQYDNWMDGKWECKLIRDGDREFYGEGKTAPEAICKAALLAKEYGLD